MKRRRNRRHMQRGVATVELAVCLPAIVIITFGAIEAANFIHFKQSLTEAAYEAARIGTSPGRTAQDAETRFDEIMTARGIHQANISFSPPPKITTPAGTPVRVTVSGPATANSYSPLLYFGGKTLTAEVVMVRL